jgi:hypothetical protein
MKKAIISAVTVAAMFILLSGAAHAKKPDEEIKDIENQIRACNEFLSKEGTLYADLDNVTESIRQVRLNIPASSAWKDLDADFSKKYDPGKAKKIFDLLSQATSLLNEGIASGDIKENKGIVAKAAQDSSASLAEIEKVSRMSPDQVADKMKADGKLAGSPKLKERLILSEKGRLLGEACERALRDLQQLGPSMAALDRAVSARLEPLQSELRMLKFHSLGSSTKEGKDEKK